MKNEPNINPTPEPQDKQPEPVVATTQAPTTTTNNGLAIAAMVVGIAAVVFGWVPFLGLVLGIVAIVLGIIALKHKIGKGMSIAGIVTGAVATIWNLVVSFLIIATLLGIAILGSSIANDAKTNLDAYDSQQQAKIDSVKDFTKGTTAIFDNFEVKINSVQRNYVPDSIYYRAANGNELIILNISVTNVGNDSNGYISSYGFEVNDNGSTDTTSFADIDNAFDGGTLLTDETSTGNLVFEVTKNATDLKLQYGVDAYSTAEDGFVTLTYTLAF